MTQEGLISLLQGALSQGRDIHDNIIVAYEILNSFPKARKNHGLRATKLYMEKSYDRFEWSTEKCFNRPWLLR